MNVVFGADIGGTDIKLGMFQEDGRLLSKWLIPTRMEDNGRLIFDDIASEIKNKMQEKSVSSQCVL